MKRLKKGPELKLPELKAPDFLADIYYDLRDRRLLPLVALVVVAIVAVPFLLGDEAEEPLPPASEAALGEADEAATLTVVEGTPGLRDYRKRLRGRTPTDPFAPKGGGGGGGAPAAGGDATGSAAPTSAGGDSGPGTVTVDELEEGEGSGGADVTGGEDETDAAPSPPAGSGEPSPPAGSERSRPPDSLEGRRLYGFRPDVRFGVAGSGKLALHTDLPLGSLLPKENAIVLFVGVTQNGERALFSVAPEVVVRGEGGCVGGDENCRFLSMREGDAVDLLTGSPGRSFRLAIESIDFVQLDLPPKSKRASGSRADEPRHGSIPGLPQNFSN